MSWEISRQGQIQGLQGQNRVCSNALELHAIHHYGV